MAGIRQPLRPGRPVRRDRGRRRRPADPRLPGEAHRRGRPAGRAGRDLRLDGQLRLHHPGALRGGRDATPQDKTSKHDMGGNIIPMLVERGEANVYDFRDNEVPGSTDRDRGYWRDVGTLDSFYDAHMDLISVHPVFNLYNFDWPIYTDQPPWPPAKFVHGWQERVGRAVGSMVSPGVGDLRGAGGELGRLPEGAGALLGARRRLGADGGRGDRPARGGPQRDPRQERRRARRAPRSASTSSATGSATPSPTTASWSSAREPGSSRDAPTGITGPEKGK